MAERTIEDIFSEVGLGVPKSTAIGRTYYTCPGCSHNRTGFNRSARCLAVNIDHLGVRLFCNHCDDPQYHRAIMFDPKKPGQQAPRQPGGQGAHRSISERAMPQRNGYEVLQQSARAKWAKR